MIYKVMPRLKIRWHDVWIGAAVTALLFTIGKFLIGLYIGKSGVASGFGAAGSLIVVFVWVYYSAQIFLMGANSHGSTRATSDLCAPLRLARSKTGRQLFRPDNYNAPVLCRSAPQ